MGNGLLFEFLSVVNPVRWVVPARTVRGLGKTKPLLPELLSRELPASFPVKYNPLFRLCLDRTPQSYEFMNEGFPTALCAVGRTLCYLSDILFEP